MVRPPIESNNVIKFLCSYGGKILPRYPDGKLRYQGGHTRVLSVPRSISYPELLLKMGELCGTEVRLRCQLPTEDLDALITIKSDEDLGNMIEEYDRITTPSAMKVRAFLLPLKSSTESPNSLSPNSLSPSSSFNSAGGSSPRYTPPPPPPSMVAFPVNYAKSAARNPAAIPRSSGCHRCCRNTSRVYLVHNGNHWQ
ncbi:RAF-like serine/threonine-protein kinase PRAF [Silene latifolia]|uniref:RAF-like serine/threonine-protein kinase PRAF n=1 Tax=Silene latifolia TaxID=37657 RepID=UPI003D77F36D